VRARGLAAAALLALCACPAPPRLAPPPTAPTPQAARAEVTPAGVIHVVRRGQTLYRIARAYGLDPGELMRANGITDPRTLAVGQELLVPGASEVREVDLAPEPPAPPPPPAPEEPGRGEASSPPPLAWPLKGVLYGRFGMRGGTRHDGIDIAAPEGTPIAAAADGKVVFVGEQSGYGNVLILRHDRDLVTVYAHASAVLVREGEDVLRGQVVARVGQTGRSTGPHLHFEVREGLKPRNPLLYLP